MFEQRWGEGYVMIANPRDLLHFRLAASDLGLLQLMDGTRTVKEIVVERFEESGEMELSTVIDLVRSLYRGNFLEQRHVDVPSMVTRAMDPVTDRRRKARQFGKTLSIEWEGAHRLVQWLYDHGLKWVFKPLVLAGADRHRDRRAGRVRRHPASRAVRDRGSIRSRSGSSC